MGCSGNPDIQTPNLDRLANTGVRFSNFFCTSPVCSPARASLLTGKIPSQHGIHDWLRQENKDETEIEYLQGQPGYTDILYENGYTCGLSGKWHLGKSRQTQKSFSHWYAHAQGGGYYDHAPMFRDGNLVHETEYITDLITKDAIDFMEDQSNKEEPFYLSVHYTAPHDPWINQHPREYENLYDESILDFCPKNKEHPWSRTAFRENHYENLRGYYAAISAMDKNIGCILDKLEALDLRENTLIWFLSDNGFNFGHHGIWGKGNGTFPLNMYDTSIKVPAIISQPGFIPQNTVCDDLVSGYDFMPTLLDLVGIETSITKNLPGKSAMPLIIGNQHCTCEREHIVIYDEYGPVRMIRTKDWKYIHRYPYGSHELYHLKEDPDETKNLVDELEYAEVVASMKNKLEKWFVAFADPAVDGVREPVTGKGQTKVAGIGTKARSVDFTLLKP